jgi:hypothetical protein
MHPAPSQAKVACKRLKLIRPPRGVVVDRQTHAGRLLCSLNVLKESSWTGLCPGAYPA